MAPRLEGQSIIYHHQSAPDEFTHTPSPQEGIQNSLSTNINPSILPFLPRFIVCVKVHEQFALNVGRPMLKGHHLKEGYCQGTFHFCFLTFVRTNSKVVLSSLGHLCLIYRVPKLTDGIPRAGITNSWRLQPLWCFANRCPVPSVQLASLMDKKEEGVRKSPSGEPWKNGRFTNPSFSSPSISDDFKTRAGMHHVPSRIIDQTDCLGACLDRWGLESKPKILVLKEVTSAHNILRKWFLLLC